MAQILFISENTVRKITNVDDNLQSKYLISAIQEAQLDLEQVIGTKLYRKIEQLIADGEIGEDENKPYKETLEAAKYYLAYLVITKVIVISTVKIGNIGVATTSDENIASIGLKDSLKVEDYYRRKADTYLSRFQKWLLKNEKDLPELLQYEVYNLRASLWSAYSGGLYLDGARGRQRYTGLRKYTYGYDKPDN